MVPYYYINKAGLLVTFYSDKASPKMPADFARMATAYELNVADNALSKKKKGLGDFWKDLTKEFQAQVVAKAATTASDKVAATAGAQSALPITAPAEPATPAAPAQSALIKYIPIVLGGAALIYFLPKFLKRPA